MEKLDPHCYVMLIEAEAESRCSAIESSSDSDRNISMRSWCVATVASSEAGHEGRESEWAFNTSRRLSG